jgi:hypothetical protein
MHGLDESAGDVEMESPLEGTELHWKNAGNHMENHENDWK